MVGLWTPPRPAFLPAGLARDVGSLWFTEIDLALADWKDLQRIRIATCPWLNCKHYTSVFSVNYDGSIGEAIVGWLGGVGDGPPIIDCWWDDRPWCWMVTEFLTGNPGSNQTYTSPASWNDDNNIIELLGAGATGGAAASNSPNASGGGGGAYQKYLNFSFAVPGTTTATYNVGAGGAQVSVVGGTSSPISANGNAGGDTYFDGATYGASSIGAKGASAGIGDVSATANGASGGLASGGIGNSTAYDGGSSGSASGGISASGGGGAAGKNDAGNSSSGSSGGGNSTAGGSGDAGSGGSGGAAGIGTGGGAAGSGVEWDASHGSGGGGGGRGVMRPPIHSLRPLVGYMVVVLAGPFSALEPVQRSPMPRSRG